MSDYNKENVNIDKSINILYNDTPFIVNSYLPNIEYDKSDKLNKENNISNNCMIFIINLDIVINDEFNKNLAEEYLFYNNLDYMVFNINNTTIEYKLPSIKYFLDMDYKTNNASYELIKNKKVRKLLEDIGFNLNELDTPYELLYIKNDETIFYQEIEMYNLITSQKNDFIFMYFYTKTYNEYKKSVYYNNKNWNVFVYPYKSPLNNTYNMNNLKLLNVYENKKNNYDINFDNVEYEKFTDKVDYLYYQNNNINNLKNTLFFSKSLINNSEFYKKNEKNETIFINLNEITEFENNNKSYLNKILQLKRSNDNKTFSLVNQIYSLTSDDKLGYLNNKYAFDKKYSTFNFNQLKKYSLVEQYYINCSISVDSPDMSILNYELYKTLVIINPLIINPDYIYELGICDIINNNNILIINFENKVEIYKKPIYTNTYYVNIYKIILKFDDRCYYIILNIAFYNPNIIYTNQNIGFNNKSYLLNNLTLIPTVYNFLKSVNIYQNVQELNLSDTKYYCYYLDYECYSNNKNTCILIKPQEFNKYAINHFYFNLSNIEVNIKYDDKNILNIYNVLENKVNDLIKNILLINNSYNIIKSNTYNCASTMVLTIELDNNISKEYIYDVIIDDILYKVLKYTNNKNICLKMNLENDDIVKKLKIDDIVNNYNFCILIRVPDKYLICSDDSKLLVGIFDDLCNLYKIDGNVYFYNLFHYKNAEFGLYRGYYIVPRIIVSDYYNIYTMNLYFDIYDILEEDNRLLFNKDCFLKKLFNYNYTKELIIYDQERLNNNVVLDSIIIQEFNKKNLEHVYDEYYKNYCIKLNAKYYLFIVNCYNIIILIKKCHYLLKELQYNEDGNIKQNIINIILTYMNYIIFLSEQNRILYLTYSETITSINNLLINITLLNILSSKEEMVNMSSYCITIGNYFKKRINMVKNILYSEKYDICVFKTIFYYEQYFKIYDKLLSNIYINIEFEKNEKVEHIFNILYLLVYNVMDFDLLNDFISLKNNLSIEKKEELNNININLDDILLNLINYNEIVNIYKINLEEVINKNILKIYNVERIITFEEFINRISHIYKNINFEYFKKLILFDLLDEKEKILYNSKEKIIKMLNIYYDNIFLNDHMLNIFNNATEECGILDNNILVKQALNYIYIKTNYKFIDI
jgi:hypothetical protein